VGAAVPLLFLLSGCFVPAGPDTGAPPPPARRVGPSLERFFVRIRDPKLTPDERGRYWQSVRNVLVSAEGKLDRVGKNVELATSVKGVGQVCVTAFPPEGRADVLTSLKPGAKIRVLGELAEHRLDGPAPCAAGLTLRNARIIVR
jgi:hypothetical protein